MFGGQYYIILGLFSLVYHPLVQTISKRTYEVLVGQCCNIFRCFHSFITRLCKHYPPECMSSRFKTRKNRGFEIDITLMLNMMQYLRDSTKQNVYYTIQSSICAGSQLLYASTTERIRGKSQSGASFHNFMSLQTIPYLANY